MPPFTDERVGLDDMEIRRGMRGITFNPAQGFTFIEEDFFETHNTGIPQRILEKKEKEYRILNEKQEIIEVVDKKTLQEKLNRGEILRCDLCRFYYTNDSISLTESNYKGNKQHQCICNACKKNMHVCCDCGFVHYPTQIPKTIEYDGKPRCDRCMGDYIRASYRNTEKGDYIRSTRTFGIELEIHSKTASGIDKLKRSLPPYFNLVHDGSILASNGSEIVSTILQGQAGEKTVKNLCEILKNCGIESSHPSCGFHVHLGGDDYYNNEVLNKQVSYGNIEQEIKNLKDKEVVGILHVVKENTKEKLSNKDLLFFLTGHNLENNDNTFEDFGGTYRNDIMVDGKEYKMVHCFRGTNNKLNRLSDSYISLKQNIAKNIFGVGPTAKKELNALYEKRDTAKTALYEYIKNELFNQEGETYIFYKDSESFARLRNLMYFYATFDDVMLGLLPTDRKIGNTYCMPMKTSFSPERIIQQPNQDELEKYWYKSNSLRDVNMRKGGKYDPSRYHGVNFHSLFNHGTVEIRFHAGETDAQRILLWVSLHQYILDRVSSFKITEDDIGDANSIESLHGKVEHMLNILKLPVHLKEYVWALIRHHN